AARDVGRSERARGDVEGRIWRDGTVMRRSAEPSETLKTHFQQIARPCERSPKKSANQEDLSYPRCSLCTVQKTPRHAMQAEAGRTIRRRYHTRSPYQYPTARNAPPITAN